ncbi:hypothetical protein B0H13DRAFT_1881647 [Mycena leptocephala]|nr:hypothetical protein B0H13DRAFT_1881647 [Mycena leptocephala]
MTPPGTPQRYQQRRRQIQRELRESQDHSPSRRRVPRNPDENVPPTPQPTLSARSLGQLRRHQRTRENRPPEPPKPPPTTRTLAQQARRARERAEKEARMDIDDNSNPRTASTPALRPLRPHEFCRLYKWTADSASNAARAWVRK